MRDLTLLLLLFCTFYFPTRSFSQFMTNGSASSLGGECYQITPNVNGQGGSIFSTNTIDLNQPFNEVVRLTLGCSEGGADGIVFLFHTTNTALGLTGGGIGYQNISPSFAVEFDTWQNTDRSDPAADHFAILQNGVNDHASANNLAGPVTTPQMEDCMEHCVVFDWDPATLTFTVTYDGNFSLSYTGDIINTIFGGNPNVFWGFTASTGGASNQHIVCLDVPELVPMPDVTICEGESTPLQADPNGDTYSWTPDPTLSATNIGNPTASPLITTTYDVTITYTCGSTATDDVTVFVNPMPIPQASSNSPLCEGETLSLMASGGSTYNWSGPNSFGSALQNPSIPNVGPQNAGTYFVTVTDGNNCSAVTSTTVTVLPPPSVTIIPPPANICEEDVLYVFTAIPAGGTWGGVADPSGTIVPAVLGPGAFDVIYTFTDANNCTAADTLNFIIFENPNVIIDPAGPFCTSDPDQILTGTPPGGTWGGFANPAGQFFPNILVAGTYNVTYSFTNLFGCSGMDEIFITVVDQPIATIDSVGPICEGSPLVALSASPPGGTWGGVADASGIVDPSTLLPGTYAVTYSFSGGLCPAFAEDSITIAPTPMVSIVPAGPFCLSNGVQNLTASPSNGTWGGAATSTGQILPSALGVGDHTVTYSFTNSAGCVDSANIIVTVYAAPTISFDSLGIVCETDPIQTVTVNPTGGTWTGSIDNLGQFNPNMLGAGNFSGNYSFVDSAGCSASETFNFQIGAIPMVSILNANSFCENEGVQTLSAVPSGGQWTGAANSMGEIDPAALGAGNYQVIYTFLSAQGCLGADTAQINILAVPTASISGTDTICSGTGDQAIISILASGTGNLSVIYAIDSINQPPLPLDSIPYFLTTAQAGTYTLVQVSDDGGCPGQTSGLGEIISASAPTIINPVAACNPGNLTYTVIFEIMDGDSSSYQVSGTPGTLTPGSPYLFTSDPIPSGSSYQFDLTDAFLCDTATISGNFSCNCITAVGQMDTTLISICGPDTISASYLDNGQVYDGNDTIIFVLHTQNGSFLGTILDTNTIPTFHFLPGSMLFGQTYYISAVVGTDDGTGMVDLNDPCIAVAPGTPIIFQPLPTADLQGPSLLCPADSGTLFFTLTGNGPFDVMVFDGNIVQSFDNINNGFSFPISLTDTTSFTVQSILDNSNPACPVSILPDWTVNVPATETTITNAAICSGDSIFLAGVFQNQPGVYVDTFIASTGCDSLLSTSLSILAIDTTLEFGTSCDSMQTGVFIQNLTNSAGCDSTIIQTITFASADSVFTTATTCDPNAAGVNVFPFINQLGCDSIVVETVTALALDTVLIMNSSCDPGSVGTFLNVVPGTDGCDSTIITTVDLLPTDTTYLLDSICDPNQTGIFTQVLTNQFGCDSLVITTLTEIKKDTTNLTTGDCDPANVGLFVDSFVGSDGCDSIVITGVGLLPTDTIYSANMICDPSQTGIFTTVLTNQFGCDSVLIETLTEIPKDTTIQTFGDCDPANVGFFSDIFLGSDGCDSVVETTIFLLQTDTLFLFDQSCNPADTGIVLTTFTNSSGCDSLVFTITQLSNPAQCPLDLSAQSITLLCNQALGDIPLIILDGVSPYNYTWLEINSGQMGNGSFANGSNTNIVDLPPGTYSITVSSSDGLINSVQAIINTSIPPVIEAVILSDFNSFGLSCSDTQDGIATVSVLAQGSPPFSYQWSTGQTSSTATNLSAGWVQVTITDVAFCEAIDSVLLIAPPPLSLQADLIQPTCLQPQGGQIELTPEGGLSPYTYQLNNGVLQASPIFGGLSDGTYSILISDANSCETTIMTSLVAPPQLTVDLGPDLEIKLGESLTLYPSFNYPQSEISSMTWLEQLVPVCTNCEILEIQPFETSTYQLQATTFGGCTGQDDITIFVNKERNVFIPTSFSPDGNGFNDWFTVFGDETVVNIKKLFIYDRWGNHIFSVFDIPPNQESEGWDGRYKNKRLDPGVFVYWAEVEFIDGISIIYKGSVTLVK